MPPIQWVKLLQNSTHFGTTSTSVRMLAPVVVKPDTVSKRASMGFVMAPLKRKGSAPHDTHGEPGQGDGHIALAHIKVRLLWSFSPQQSARKQTEDGGYHKRPAAFFLIDHRSDAGQDHKRGLITQHTPDNYRITE